MSVIFLNSSSVGFEQNHMSALDTWPGARADWKPDARPGVCSFPSDKSSDEHNNSGRGRRHGHKL